jgi:hypothetical protein
VTQAFSLYNLSFFPNRISKPIQPPVFKEFTSVYDRVAVEVTCSEREISTISVAYL